MGCGLRASRGEAREGRPLVDEELRAATAGEALGQPAERSERGVQGSLDVPAVRFEELDQIAPRHPAKMRPVAMAPVGVAKRAVDDEIAEQRPVPRVRHRYVE